MLLRLLLIISVLLSSTVALAEWQPLYDRVDKDLQAAMDRKIKATPEWAELVRKKKMAVGLVDLSGEPRFARVNGNQMMYAASLPKIAILVAAYAAIADGSLEETEELHEHAARMIRVSSNTSATWMIDKIGMRKIQAVLKDPQYGFYDESRGGGLWVGKRYAKAGPRQGDPVNNISHGATVTQVSRLFYLLSTGKLVSEEASAHMLEDLSNPGIHHKFVSQIDERAPGATMYRKSGTWRQWHADSVMVRGSQWRNYILVGLIENEDGERILRELLPAMEELIVPIEFAAGTHE